MITHINYILTPLESTIIVCDILTNSYLTSLPVALHGQIAIEATAGVGYSGDIAIDNIRIQPNACWDHGNQGDITNEQSMVTSIRLHGNILVYIGLIWKMICAYKTLHSVKLNINQIIICINALYSFCMWRVESIYFVTPS